MTFGFYKEYCHYRRNAFPKSCWISGNSRLL